MKRLPTKRMELVARCAVLIVIAQATLCQWPALAQETDFRRDRFLLLDARIIESTENVELALGTVKKHKANPLFGEDKPWEKRFDNLYGNVQYDQEENIYKCWYSPFIVDNSAKGMTLEERDAKPYHPAKGREMGICYATSKDGLHWEKPDLGLVEYEGSKANNIIMRRAHGAGVFKDYSDPDPARRYKMVYKLTGIATSYSPDGLNWSYRERLKDIGTIRGDTHNNCFWDPQTKKYFIVTRTKSDKGREVTIVESDDFVTWKNDGVVMQGLDVSLQPYAMPVFMHGGVYLGLVAIHAQRPIDRVWTELAWSPDAITWHRILPGEKLIPCSEKVLDHDYGCVFPCAYPIFMENEIRLYYGGSDYYHYGWRTGSLSLATLRPDGFAGYEQESKAKPGIISTSAIARAGEDIRITADVEEGGFVKVSILDQAGVIIAEAEPVSETVTDARLRIKKPILPDKIRLQFELVNAKIYSFSFGN